MTAGRLAAAALALVLALGALAGVPVGAAPSPNVVVSQLYGGGGNTDAPFTNDYVELFNRGTAAQPLDGWSLQYTSATGTGNLGANPSQLVVLSGTIPPGGYYLVALAGGANGSPLPAADQTGSINMSGSAGKVAVVADIASLGCNGGSTPCDAAQLAKIVDLVGYGNANFFEGSAAAPTLSTATAALRAGGGCTDTDQNGADFASGAPAPRNSASPANPCDQPQTPTDTPTPSPTPTTAPPTLIRAIQGAGHLSPLNGQSVGNVPGVVTALRSNGFYLQDPTPDTDDRTSEALFVFTSSAPNVVVGDAVSVRGSVAEFRPGGLTNLTTTEITTSNASVTVLSHGNPLPAPIVIGLGGRVPPTQVIDDDATGDVETSGTFDPASDGIDFYESLEAMRVQVDDAVVVGPRNDFGEFLVLANGGAGAGLRTARGGIVIRPTDFNPERVMVDDEVLRLTGGSTPAVDVGDRLAGPIAGVLDYNFGNFRIQATEPLTRVAGGLARETAAPGRPSELVVATFNVENLDPADGPTKINALAQTIVARLGAPDLVAVEEIQDNNGPVNDAVVDASATYNALIAAIQATGGPAYQFRQIDPVDDRDGGEPGGNIRVGFLFRTDRGLAFVDRPGGTSTAATTVVTGSGGPSLSFSPGRLDPTNPAFANSRKPLAGEFTYNGQTVFVVANHFNSKGGDQPLFGRFQPPTRVSEIQRGQQAQVVRAFVAQLLTADPSARVVVLGDLNDFEFSSAVTTVEAAGLTTLIETLPENERYSYVFEGNSQTLDHILVSGALVREPFAYDVVHANAEFAEQISDHDPQVARFTIVTPESLCALVRQYVTRRGAETALCVELRLHARLSERDRERAADALLRVFTRHVEQLLTRGELTAEQASTLIRLVGAL